MRFLAPDAREPAREALGRQELCALDEREALASRRASTQKRGEREEELVDEPRLEQTGEEVRAGL